MAEWGEGQPVPLSGLRDACKALARVRAGVARSMTPAQVVELCDQIEQEILHG